MMKLTLIRQINSCCTLNYFYKTNAPIDINVIGNLFTLNETYKVRGYVFIDNDEYMIYSIIGSNEIKIVAKKKSFDVLPIITKLELM